MIVSTKGKRAANAVEGRFGKGFPADLVKRTRAMLSALDAAVVLEDLRFPPGNHLEELKATGPGSIPSGSTTSGASASCGPIRDRPTSRSSTTIEGIGHRKGAP